MRAHGQPGWVGGRAGAPLTWLWLKNSSAPEHMSSRASTCLLCDMYLRGSEHSIQSQPCGPQGAGGSGRGGGLSRKDPGVQCTGSQI